MEGIVKYVPKYEAQISKSNLALDLHDTSARNVMYVCNQAVTNRIAQAGAERSREIA